MAIGIQSAGIAEQGLAPQGTIAAPVQAVTIAPPQTEHADNWLKQDLDNPFIVPWGEFDVNPNIDFQQTLRSAYGGGTPTVPMMFGGAKMGPNGVDYSSMNTLQPIPVRGGPFGTTTSQKQSPNWLPNPYKGAINSINFVDKNLDAAIDELNASARGRLSPAQRKLGTDTPFYNARSDKAWDKQLNFRKPNELLPNSYGWAPVSRLTDGAARDKMFGDVSAKYGIRLDDLQNKYGVYDKALRSITDPVGANWQDLKSSPIYDKLLSGIRGYSEASTGSYDKRGNYHAGSTNDAYFDKINKMVPDYKSNPDFLPAEYFVLHQPKAALSGRGGENISAYTRDLARLGNQGTAHKGFSALPGHDPYARQDWTDYADANKAAWQYTPLEVENAKKAMAHHIDLLDNKAEDGGPFNLMKEAGVTTPKAKGGKWYWKDSPYTGQLNAAQNMLYHNTQGEKNFEDAGYNANAAIRDSMRFQKKKKKGFMGGLGKILGPVASIASFIPGPWQLPAQLYNVIGNAAGGNLLGAAAGLAGANFGGSTAGGLSGSFAGKAASTLGNTIGNTAANALVSGGLGALQAAKSGNALKGGLTAALGSGTGAFKSDAIAKLTDSLGKIPAEALVNAGIGAGQGALQGDAALGAILGGMGPLVNAGLGTAGLGKAGSAFGTGLTQGAVQTKAKLDKQKKAIAKALAQRNRGAA